ncbi:MAG: hypothetical protein ACK4GB_06185 [Tepidimonas sp.]
MIDAKGKVRKTYPPDWVQTPLEKLALQMTDLQASEALNAARLLLFATIAKRSRPAA